MPSTLRQPAVAGRFYPASRDKLSHQVLEFVPEVAEKIAAVGCIAPHAGYVYSGHVAGAVYAHLALPRRHIILCPNHTGFGETLSIMSHGAWLTPLGETPIDTVLARNLQNAFTQLHEDTLAHESEHAIEVQLPFLQTLVPDFTFVPIAVGTNRLDYLESLGRAMALTIRESKEPVLMIASSDMNHYESDSATRAKDRMAIESILRLDPRQLYEVVADERISMCGMGCSVAMLTAARLLGATHAKLIKYATSADVSGDYDHCVGYAGVIVS